MRRRRAVWTLLFATFVCARSAPGAEAEKVSDLLGLLRSEDVFERERAEAQLRQLDRDSLVSLSLAVTGSSLAGDRATRFRAGRLLSQMLQDLLLDFEKEQHSYALDLAAQEHLQRRQRSAAAMKKLEPRLQELRARDPEIDTKLEKLSELLDLERVMEERRKAGEGNGKDEVELPAPARTALEKLRAERASWIEADPEFLRTIDPLMELYQEARLGDGRELSQVEELHLEELGERVKERKPRVERLREQVWEIGLPALNEALVRRQIIRAALQPFYDDLVSTGLDRFDATRVDGPEQFETVRYTRGLLWAWLAERDGEAGRPARELLDRHIEGVLKDLEARDALIRTRASDELFFLGDVGMRALRQAADGAPARSDVPASTSATNSAPHGFLADLLRWRIRPSTYARVGIHFADFPNLSFRRKRRRIFNYTKVAGEQAITTLRAIVTNDDLEDSFLVKLAAAKALAGLRDLSGYNYLVANHPEMTMKRPEVSRELLIIQGYEYIKDKQYRLAVDELRKVLDEYPFDFRANYHIAFAYLLLKDYEKSVHYFEIARRINPKDQLTLYNLACAYSLHGKTDEAIEALEASVEAGFTDYEHIQKDPDLDPIRGDERYRRLMSRLRSSDR